MNSEHVKYKSCFKIKLFTLFIFIIYIIYTNL